ncbi:DUF697 domain-containing protein [Lewinella sp. W8]|uniref:DUF697 domain-containing protein n=1 Tax=Lewinella sp. W8 TaxID=2528208 RepID=UPI001068B60B|nr:DUF697 domain-containing protein [Lewinella sp. W8]MTB51996.1 DUF697 domain-containing protein [Lewinella sp. W8]
MSSNSDNLPIPMVSDAQREEANSIIKRYALLGTATGLIPVFGLDVAANTALQTKMIKDLADVYEYDIDEQLLRTAITSGITSLGSRILTGIAAGLATSFPLFKTLASSAAQAAVAGFITMEIGRIYQAHMEEGQNPAEIDVMVIINHIVEQVQEGKWDPMKVANPASHIQYLFKKE